MDSELLERRHPEFPDRVWVIIEQPPNEPKRMEYLPEKREFVRTEIDSLAYVKGFTGAYGWISGTGIPPGVHFDALVLTEREVLPGHVVEGSVAGVFFMRSGDHKFVVIDAESHLASSEAELYSLPGAKRAELEAIYPEVREGEGWRGATEARHHLRHVAPTHD